MGAPRWLSAIENAIAQHENQTVFQLVTIDSTASIPQARSHRLRSFIVPPTAPALPLIVTTTDIRTPKVLQIVSNPSVHVVHWIEGTQEQYRFSGRAFVVPAPESSLHTHFLTDIHGTAQGKSGIAALVKTGFDWEKKRVDTFKSLGGHMRATWCRPVPSTPLISSEEAEGWLIKLEEAKLDDTEESKQHWKTALGNFALLIIEPNECDYLELGVIPNRRTKFIKADDGTWKEEQLVP